MDTQDNLLVGDIRTILLLKLDIKFQRSALQQSNKKILNTDNISTFNSL